MMQLSGIQLHATSVVVSDGNGLDSRPSVINMSMQANWKTSSRQHQHHLEHLS